MYIILYTVTVAIPGKYQMLMYIIICKRIAMKARLKCCMYIDMASTVHIVRTSLCTYTCTHTHI